MTPAYVPWLLQSWQHPSTWEMTQWAAADLFGLEVRVTCHIQMSWGSGCWCVTWLVSWRRGCWPTWHHWFVCAMTQWLLVFLDSKYVCRDSSIRAMTQSWLTRMYHDRFIHICKNSFILDMTHPYVPRVRMCHDSIAACLFRMGHGTYDCDMARQMYDSAMAHMNESWPEVYPGLWVSHNTYDYDMLHMIWFYHGTYEWVMPSGVSTHTYTFEYDSIYTNTHIWIWFYHGTHEWVMPRGVSRSLSEPFHSQFRHGTYSMSATWHVIWFYHGTCKWVIFEVYLGLRVSHGTHDWSLSESWYIRLRHGTHDMILPRRIWMSRALKGI